MSIDLHSIQQRMAAGDTLALKALYDAYANRLYQLAIAIVHSAEMAEEVVEDVFIELWKRRQRVAEVENLHLYMYVAVRNISRTYLRRYKNKSSINFDEVQLPFLKVDITPEHILISTEIVNRINVSINELPARCRLIFKLVKEDGLKQKEAAELLGVSVKTIENQLAIAIKKIHSAIRIYLPA